VARLRVGTRGSALALAQSGQTVARLEQAGVPAELVVIKTSGDKLANVSLAKVGGKGLFIKELEEALVANEIDLAIHSMKDVPAELPPGFALAAVTARADVRDVLVRRAADEPAAGAAVAGHAAGSHALSQLPALVALPRCARVGTGSLRRRAQLAALRDDLDVLQMRGNVDTRLRKLEDGEYDAIVLAAAGLARLGISPNAAPLAADAFLPAPGQGALAIETRADDVRVRELLGVLDDPASRAACAAERAFLRELGASCQVPVAAYARVADGGRLTLDGLVASLDGSRVLRDVAIGTVERAAELGRELADLLASRGAHEILRDAEEQSGTI
jgi:hydroxymethylbilane synthase